MFPFAPRRNFFHYLAEYLVKISLTLFKVSTIAFIAYFALESFKTGLISNYFDLNLLLILSILSGLVVILFYRPEAQKKELKNHYLLHFILIFVFALFLFLSLHFLGKIGLIMSVLGAASLYLIINLFNRHYYD
ncbi:MAG: hypothetical protein NTZ18_01510 [Candidatus Komeilibacteria bacterium]|nr:hypothetical protein [Candidatus Komeilibacteria bacterium]